MDRDAIARAQRRRHAQEALEFERNRATSLEEQVEEIVAETEGPRVDEETFARMAPEDAEAVRAILHPDGTPDVEEEWLGLDDGESEPDADEAAEAAEAAEEEIVRLREEIAESRRRQDALERYVEALGG